MHPITNIVKNWKLVFSLARKDTFKTLGLLYLRQGDNYKAFDYLGNSLKILDSPWIDVPIVELSSWSDSEAEELQAKTQENND